MCQIVFFVYQCDIQMPRKENEEEEDLFSLGIRKEKSSPSANIKNQSSNCQLFVADFKIFSSMKTQNRLKSDFSFYTFFPQFYWINTREQMYKDTDVQKILDIS